MMVRLFVAISASLGLHLALLAGVGSRIKPPSVGGGASTLNVSFQGQVTERSGFVAMHGKRRLHPQRRMTDAPLAVADENVPVSDKRGEGQAIAPSDGEFLPILPPEWLDERIEYLPASDVDERPVPLGPVMVPPPNDAEWNSNKGYLVLLLYINAKGVVERAEVESSDVPESVSNAAIHTFTGVEMQPGVKGGVSVNTKMKIRIDYDAIIAR